MTSCVNSKKCIFLEAFWNLVSYQITAFYQFTGVLKSHAKKKKALLRRSVPINRQMRTLRQLSPKFNLLGNSQ